MPSETTLRVVRDEVEARGGACFGVKDALKALPGARWESATKAWMFPKSPFSAAGVAAVMGAAQLTFEASSGVNALLTQYQGIVAAQTCKEADGLPPIPVTRMDRPPWRHQLRAFHFASKLPGALLTMDMGTGKTRVAVTCFRTTSQNPATRRARS